MGRSITYSTKSRTPNAICYSTLATVNTEAHQFPIPAIEQELTKLDKSCFWARFDISHSYWQIYLDRSSHALHTFIAPEKIIL